MAEQGYKTRILAGEYDLSRYTKGVQSSQTRKLIDVTVMQPGATVADEAFIPGRGSGDITIDGLLDFTSGASDAQLDAIMDGSLQVVTVSWQGGNTIGDRARILNGRFTEAPINASGDDAVTFTSGRQASGAARSGVILHPHVERSSAANYASVDNAASSAFGSVAHLHVTEFNGTNATITVADSTDDAVFADHITFGAVTAATSERATAIGTVNRYARVELSGTFTTITFTVAFARLNQ